MGTRTAVPFTNWLQFCTWILPLAHFTAISSWILHNQLDKAKSVLFNYRTPLTRINRDGEPSGLAWNPDNWLFLCKQTKIGSLRFGCYYLQYVKGKLKRSLVQALRLCTGRTANRGSRGIALLFLDHGTRRGEWSASRLDRSLPPGKTRYPLYRRLGGPQCRSGQVRKISSPTGFDPRTVQPVASRYNDWATGPHLQYVYASKTFDQAWFAVLEAITLYCAWSDNR